MKIFKDTKGAVTVFVTLLLVPAILVSGTAVDLARIHTARSILQDANQLAANSVLTQYNALLYDIYGLFGVALDDPIFGQLLDDYIRVAVFGEELQDRRIGTLQIFYGADLSLEEPLFAEGKTLRNEDVLRRQIEEYMQFRGPVVIVKEFLDALDGNTISEDTAVISDKLAIEADIARLHEKYKQLYEAIAAADRCNQAIGGIAGGHFGATSRSLTAIRSQFVELARCYSDWEKETDPVAKADYKANYWGIVDNIMSLTAGGPRGSNWNNGGWTSVGNVIGLNKNIENAKLQADAFKPRFDAVVLIAREIDAMHDEIGRKVDELERKLDDGECGDEMRQALTEKHGEPPMSIIERYRDILRWDDIESLAERFKTGGYDYIDDEVKPMLDEVRYRNADSAAAGSLTREELAALSSNPGFNLIEGVLAENSKAAYFARFPDDKVTYKMPPGFLKFAEHPGENSAFFETLTAMVNQPELDPVKLFEGQEDGEGEDAQEKQQSIIDALMNLVQTAYTGLTNTPLGAMHIGDSETTEAEAQGVLEILASIPEALGAPVINIIKDPLGSLAGVGDYLLLLTYCTSMFSNYTTTKPDSIGKSMDEIGEIEFTKSISGVPISPEVNYFFQSEWEYLYEGNENAGKNLSAITRLIFLVRMVCNYIAVFSVSEVTTVVTAIQSAFAWCPPVGIVLGELARAAFVAAESVVDIMLLRSGHKVSLIKNAGGGAWVCSPSGVVDAVTNVISNEVINRSDDNDDEKGLTYSNYMMFFFVTKAVFYIGNEEDAVTELAKRTANLIEWNIINFQNGVFADEEKMAEALTDSMRFRLADLNTDFSITTTANIRMLFLSMVFAQNFSNTRGLDIPSSIPVVQTDYRGY